MRPVNKTVAEKPVKPICRPPKPTVPCGERRKCVPDYDGATALVQPFPTAGPLFGKLNLPKPELQRQIGGLGGKVRSYKMISVSLDERGCFSRKGQARTFKVAA